MGLGRRSISWSPGEGCGCPSPCCEMCIRDRFQGVALDESGKPTRWRVENSWGKEAGENGYDVMSDEWFTQYTYQVVVNKKYLTAQQVEELSQEPIQLEPWDPMGSHA